MEVELVWTGKHDRRSSIEVVKIEPVEVFGGSVSLFSGGQDEWSNMLVWGDNVQIMHKLVESFRGRIDLIYIDPPFATGLDFTRGILVGDDRVDVFVYRDRWSGGLPEYLSFMYERLLLMRELLSETGSIYLHCDWRTNSYLRLIMDEIFGPQNFRREIVWDVRVLSGFKTTARNWVRGHDTILFYTKSDAYKFRKLTTAHDPKYIELFRKVDEHGRRYFDGRGERRYLDEVLARGKSIGDVWDDIKSFQQMPMSVENVHYPTQKPEALLERIILSATDEGDIVADFFCGSGTTLVVAEKLGRRWIGVDMSRQGIHTSRKRLLSISTHSFVLYKAEGMGCHESREIDVEVVRHSDGCVDVKLTGFRMPVDALPAQNREALRKRLAESPLDFIDYWAIDFDYKPNQPFRICWYGSRSGKRKSLDTQSSCAWRYEDTSQMHLIAVKVVDVFGVEAMKIVRVQE